MAAQSACQEDVSRSEANDDAQEAQGGEGHHVRDLEGAVNADGAVVQDSGDADDAVNQVSGDVSEATLVAGSGSPVMETSPETSARGAVETGGFFPDGS